MVSMDFLAHNSAAASTGGSKAIQRPKNSEPKRSKQVSIEMNTAGAESVYSSETRRGERTICRM